jgi:MFS family permease
MAGLWPLLGESIKSSLTSKTLIAHNYSIAVIGGPTVGPLIGSAITNSYLGWRWTEYITSFLIFLLLVIDVLILPETYAVSCLCTPSSFKYN